MYINASRPWVLGQTARVLAIPYVAEVGRVVTSRELEIEFLQASWTRQHALLAAIDITLRRNGHLTPQSVLDLKTRFEQCDPKHIVESAFGIAVPGFSRAVEALGPQRALTQGAYLRLAEVLTQGQTGAKTVHHRRHLRFEDIDRLHSLPDPLRTDAVLGATERSLARVRSLLSVLKARNVTLTPRQADRLVRITQDHNDLAGYLLELKQNLRFPDPPFKGSKSLRWVGTAAELVAVSRCFENCVAEMVEPCLTGTRAFYLYQGFVPAMVGLNLTGGVQWEVEDIKGPRNAGLSVEARRAILAEVPLDEINQRLAQAQAVPWSRFDTTPFHPSRPTDHWARARAVLQRPFLSRE